MNKSLFALYLNYSRKNLVQQQQTTQLLYFFCSRFRTGTTIHAYIHNDDQPDNKADRTGSWWRWWWLWSECEFEKNLRCDDAGWMKCNELSGSRFSFFPIFYTVSFIHKFTFKHSHNRFHNNKTRPTIKIEGEKNKKKYAWDLELFFFSKSFSALLDKKYSTQ